MPKIQTQEYIHTLSELSQKRVANFLQTPPKILKSKLGVVEKEFRQIYRYYKKIQDDNYIIKDKYSEKDSFRMYGVKTTLQSIKKSARNLLVENDCYDIDIQNSLFNVAKYIIKSYFESKYDQFNLLIDYAENREKYLTDDFDKDKYIKLLFSQNPNSYCRNDLYSTETNELIKQIHNFQKLTIENKDKFNIDCDIKKNPNNPDGTTMSFIYHYFENKILQQIIKKYKDIMVAPVFDGVFINKDCDLETVLNGCNEIGESFGVKFINKEFKKTDLYNSLTELLDSDLPPSYDEFNDNYKNMKTDFEEKHFMVKKPLMYIEHDDIGNYQTYNKSDFADLVAPYHWTTNMGKKVTFFNEWIRDKDRRIYTSINWIPSTKEELNMDNNYNSFKGFKSELIDVPDANIMKYDVTENYDGEAVKLINKHIRFMTGSDGGAKYIMNYIAHMFQKPEELPLVAIIFKSMQGSGKDILTDIIGEIVGNSLIYKDSKMENLISGTFNASLKNKLLVQINEVCGKDGHFNKELLKDLITVKNLKIREMRTDIQEMTNYLRLFLCTNNLNAISIPKDDRRYCVFRCGEPKNKKYYDNIGSIMGNKLKLDSIYSYFMTRDISKFDIKDRFLSDEYKTLQDHNSNPFYEFLIEFTKNQQGIRTQNDKSYVPVYELDTKYKRWLQDNNMEHIEVNSKTNKLVFLVCKSVKDKRFYVNKKQVRGYEYELDTLKTYLEKYHGQAEQEVISFDN